VVDSQNKVETREVKVVRTIGDLWLVDGGLAPGDRLIVEGVQKVQPGMQVRPVEQAVAAASGEAAPVAVATAHR
jgi:membrane fusion protein (multidrug efflux system)